MKNLVVVLINYYQKTLSPDHGFMRARYVNGFCRFYPSCSEYTKQVIIKDGVLRGVVKGAWRVLRCNPLSQPKVDNP